MNKNALSLAIAALLSPSLYAADTDDAEPLDEVVVTGTRAALIESRELKKNAGIVQDSIVAEDLGRFPDANVADSL